jgi:hypothetical protein
MAGQPAKAIAFSASDGAGFITRQVLDVNGSYLIVQSGGYAYES